MPYQLFVTIFAIVFTVRFLVLPETSMIAKSVVLFALTASFVFQVYVPQSLIPLVMQGALGIGLAFHSR
jgi:hypothetical protein